MNAAALLAEHRTTLRAIGAAMVPELTHADEDAWREIEGTIEHALDGRPAKVRRQLALLLRVIAGLGIARFGRPLEHVGRERCERFLLALQHAPVKLIRRGLWGVRTLVLMGHYARPAVRTAIGYNAQRGGWSARALDAAPRPDVT